MKQQEILKLLPYSEPFLFVETIISVDELGAKGAFTFHKELDFFKGHFKGNPVVPGVILTECCAQIGLVCLGIHLLSRANAAFGKNMIAMSSSEMDFYLPVYPGERVTVHSVKNYYRFNKLQCNVKMLNEKDELICKGVLAGMLKPNSNE